MRLVLLGASVALVAVGIATIYAVGHPAQSSPAGISGELGHFSHKQLIFAGAGAAVFVLVNLINYRRFGAAAYWIYGAVLGLLAVLLVGRYIVELPFVPQINGTHRWIRVSLGGWDLPAVQPSEICKLAYVLALAWYLRYRSNYRSMKALIGPFALTVLPMVLILLEPDLGTVMLMMPVFFAMLFVAGAKVRHLVLIVLLTLIVSPLLWWKMKPYQRVRISSIVLQNEWICDKAEKHPVLGEILVGTRFSEKQWNEHWGYHLMRSKFAVASGGLAGYGFRRGPFIKYDFLPTRHNDFVFAVIAHQWGFWGSLALVGLYALVIGAGLDIAVHNTDPFGRLLAAGIVAMFAVEVIVNVSMTMGLMPITGLTLPLVSYGGSSLVVSMAAVGLLNNVGRCRPFGMAREIPGRPLLNFILRKS